MKPEKIFAFDDGSIESKVMQHELKNTYDIQPIKVEKYEDLPTWLDNAIKYIEGTFTGIIKIFLHFPFEDYIQKDIRTVIQEAERKNPKLRIIPWYEQAHRQGLQNRAANYGITTEIYDKTLLNKDVVEKEKPELIIPHDDPNPYLEKLGKVYGNVEKEPKPEDIADNKKVADEVMHVYQAEKEHQQVRKNRKKKFGI